MIQEKKHAAGSHTVYEKRTRNFHEKVWPISDSVPSLFPPGMYNFGGFIYSSMPCSTCDIPNRPKASWVADLLFYRSSTDAGFKCFFRRSPNRTRFQIAVCVPLLPEPASGKFPSTPDFGLLLPNRCKAFVRFLPFSSPR